MRWNKDEGGLILTLKLAHNVCAQYSNIISGIVEPF
jgi:hypothetical protein